MKTHQSFVIQKLFAGSLESPLDIEKDDAKDPVRVEAGFKSWLTRWRRDMADLNQKIAAHHAAGERTLAEVAEGEKRNMQQQYDARVAVRVAAGLPIPAATHGPAPQRRDRAQERLRAAGQPDVRAAARAAAPRPPVSHHGSGEPNVPVPVAAPAPAPVVAQKPRVREFQGNDAEMKHKYREEFHKLQARGFLTNVGVPGMSEGGKHGIHIVTHPDGRRVEMHLTLSGAPGGQGNLKILAFPAPKPEGVEEPKAPRKPRAQVDRFEGEAHELEAHAKAEGERFRREGFKQENVDPISVVPDEKGNVSGGEVLQHPDGRKVEINVEFNHNDGKGKVEVKQHAAPPPPPPMNLEGIDEMSDSKGEHTRISEKELAGWIQGLPVKERDAVLAGHIKKGGREFKELGGSGAGRWVLRGGEKIAVFKPAGYAGLAKGRVRDTMDNSVNESQREHTAFLISKQLGHEMPPVILLKDTPHGEAHLMGYVSGSDGGSIPRDASGHSLAALDWIIGNTDRHGANYKTTPSGKVVAVDNGLSFPNFPGLSEAYFNGLRSIPLSSLQGKPIHSDVKASIRRMTPEFIEKVMRGHGFDDYAIESTKARLKVAQTWETWPKHGQNQSGFMGEGSESQRILKDIERDLERRGVKPKERV